MGRLDGRVAIVTGGGRGIGRGIAIALAKEGASLCIAELDPATGKDAASELQALGANALAVACDVSQRDQVTHAVAAAVAEFGGLDVLVNNATGAGQGDAYKPLLEQTDEDWDRKLSVDLKGSFYCMVECHPHLRERRGKVINLCSIAGSARTVGFASYSAAKEGLRALTGVAAKEWGADGIKVNALCPTALTPGIERFMAQEPEVAAGITADIPLGRLGDPERDIGRVAVFLASSDSDYMTGQTLWVDGGQEVHA